MQAGISAAHTAWPVVNRRPNCASGSSSAPHGSSGQRAEAEGQRQARTRHDDPVIGPRSGGGTWTEAKAGFVQGTVFRPAAHPTSTPRPGR